MRLSREQLDSYNAEMHACQQGAEDYFRGMMRAWRADNPNAPVAECREFCLSAMGESLGMYAGPAQELAAQMFEWICEQEGIDASAEVPTGPVDPKLMREKVHFYARKLAGEEADWSGFVDDSASLTNYYVRRSAYETTRLSCMKGNVRWARVPTGRETCAYCFMLASRGWDYVSEDTAHAGSHQGCNCIVVPGKKGRTAVAGYDPEGLSERWGMCQRACGSTDYGDVIREVETRDWDWLWSGKPPKVEFASEQVKKRVTEAELGTAQRLSENGVKAVFIQDYKWVTDGGRKRKVGLPDLSNGIEIKTLGTSGNAYGAVDNYLENASSKVGLRCVVIDNTKSERITDKDLIEAASEVFARYATIPRLRLLLKDGRYIEVAR